MVGKKKRRPAAPTGPENGPVSAVSGRTLEEGQGPASEAAEQFDALMAEETRKTPPPARTIGPVDVGAMIFEKLALPSGAALDLVSREISFRIPPDEDKDLAVEAVITAGNAAAADAALDAAIRAAEPEKTWRHEDAAFFLHAVQHSRPKRTEIRLKYIFRQRPSEASGERR